MKIEGNIRTKTNGSSRVREVVWRIGTDEIKMWAAQNEKKKPIEANDRFRKQNEVMVTMA